MPYIEKFQVLPLDELQRRMLEALPDERSDDPPWFKGVYLPHSERSDVHLIARIGREKVRIRLFGCVRDMREAATHHGERNRLFICVNADYSCERLRDKALNFLEREHRRLSGQS